jgi:hypothetical protein
MDGFEFTFRGPSIKTSNELDNFVNAVKGEKEKNRHFLYRETSGVNAVKAILTSRANEEKSQQFSDNQAEVSSKTE